MSTATNTLNTAFERIYQTAQQLDERNNNADSYLGSDTAQRIIDISTNAQQLTNTL
jgi:hypothetical protein